MHLPKPAAVVLPILCLSMSILSACYKEEIKFGNMDNDPYTRIITIDTITPVISTFVLDSFPTSGNNMLLVGRWEDPLMGATRASTYFQVGLPSGVTSMVFPNDAVFDSIALTLKPNRQYYGDTAGVQTFSVYELGFQPDYTYSSKLYNTSSTIKLPRLLGSVTRAIRPYRDDSIQITLPYDKGSDIFEKIRIQATEIKSEDNFLNYLRGFCLQVGDHDKGAIYGFNGDSSVMMNMYYHTKIPVYQEHIIGFTLTRTGYQYNQVLTNRDNTPLQRQFAGQQEFFPTAQQPYAFTQAGTGVMMKVKFPSLRNILGLGSVVKLLNAKIVIKPVEKTYDEYGYRLPDTLFLSQTDATNTIGYAIPDASGAGTQYSIPSIDHIYHLNTNYSFDVSSYINYLLNTPGSAEGGVFVLEEYPGSALKLNRALMGTGNHPKYKSQLSITVMVVE